MSSQQTFARIIRTFSASALALLMFSSSLQAQTGDWNAVKNLASGTRIIVKAQRTYYCGFEGANDAQLVCEVHKPRSFGTIVVAIPRTEVREVRTLPNQAKAGAVGAGIGAATGAAIGATNETSPGANAFFGGLGGALIGLTIGMTVSTVRLALRRGKVIYKR